jgi:hypothetical protein
MWEPPIGIEPMTYALRGACSRAADPLAAQIAPIIALTALSALGLSGDPVHEPVHARTPLRPRILLLHANVADDMDPRPQADRAPGAEG